MCGRFTLTLKVEDLKDATGVEVVPPDYQPRFNIAPTQPVAVLDQYPANAIEMMRWGLVPSWAQDLSIGSRMINARAETVESKPAFRKAFAERRCLILADGFYEWHRSPSGKGPSQPYYFHAPQQKVIAFAGLWETWYPKEGEPVRSCTIITTTANPIVQPVHDRMPVILPKEKWQAWLEKQSTADLLEFLQPLPAEEMKSFAVSQVVNNPAVDQPACVAPWGGA